MKFQIFKKFKTTEWIFFISYLLSIILLTYRLFSNCIPGVNCVVYEKIIYLTTLSIIFGVLGYIAYKDFKTMEIDNLTSLVLMLFLIVITVILFFIPDYKDWAFQKLLGAIILGSVFQLIVLLTKEKGLGQGDVRLAIISGILVGMDNLILWLYVTIFSALIYGLFLAKKKKKFKGLKIPFVPFMVLGMVVILLILI
ncbi:MAG: prepilin peptidase [Candidatus Dojkabacteria bacterium]